MKIFHERKSYVEFVFSLFFREIRQRDPRGLIKFLVSLGSGVLFVRPTSRFVHEKQPEV